MNKRIQNKLLLEFLWWLLTAILLLIVYLPLIINKIDFPYKLYNFFFIITAITFTRLIFQLKHTFLAFNLVLKFIFMFGSVVVIMLAYRGISLLNIFNDENGYYFLFEHLDLEQRYDMAAYVNWQYFLFGIAASVAALIFPFRLLISIFRVTNRGEE